MQIGLLCDELSDGWYSTNLVKHIHRTPMDQDSIHVYTFADDQQIEDVTVVSDVNSLLYPLTLVKAIREEGIDVFHIQFEFVMCDYILGTSLMPLLLLFGRAAGAKMVVTLHGPIHEPGKLEQLSALSPPKYPSRLVAIYLVGIITMIILSSHRTIVHGEVFKQRVLDIYPVPESKIIAIQHGVADVG